MAMTSRSRLPDWTRSADRPCFAHQPCKLQRGFFEHGLNLGMNFNLRVYGQLSASLTVTYSETNYLPGYLAAPEQATNLLVC
jgi:hypothetical protein